MNLYHYIPACYGLKSIKQKRLKVSKATDLNDPFDCYPEVIAEADLEYPNDGNALSEWIKEVGIVCYSENAKDVLMWSHYADRHKGIVLDFEFPEDLRNIKKVEYDKPRPKINLLKLCILDPKSSMDFGLDLIKECFSIKEKSWSYEQEQRDFVPLVSCVKDESNKELYFYDFPMNYLKGVILGGRCDLDKNRVLEELEKSGYQKVYVKRVQLSDTDFSIDIIEC